MSIHKTEAIVLNRRNFRETSMIADFFTLDFGKVSGVLKGIKEDVAKFASTVEPFSSNEIVFYKKTNSSLQLVSQCDLRDNFNAIRQDISKVGIASLMMELLSVIMPQEEKNEEIFHLTRDSLLELANNKYFDKIITIFKIKLLSLSGFKPHLDSCVTCDSKIVGQSKFSLRLGGLLCPSCVLKDKNSRMIFRGTIATILHIEKNNFRTNLNLGINPQIRRELDSILNAFLNFHLEKEFKAQKVLNHL